MRKHNDKISLNILSPDLRSSPHLGTEWFNRGNLTIISDAFKIPENVRYFLRNEQINELHTRKRVDYFNIQLRFFKTSTRSQTLNYWMLHKVRKILSLTVNIPFQKNIVFNFDLRSQIIRF